MLKTFKHLDCLITPAATMPAPKSLESTGDPAFNAPWSFCGFPSITIPSGLAKGRLPMGIQLVGRSFEEQNLLNIAWWSENVIGFKHTPQLAH